MDLGEFLLARIAEDEAEIAAGFDFAVLDSSGWMGHAAGWGRERALAECDAKRRIVELHQYAYDLGPYCEHCTPRSGATGEPFTGSEFWPCPTLRALAAPYASHPDFRPEWSALADA